MGNKAAKIMKDSETEEDEEDENYKTNPFDRKRINN
jgi:hypothetical protein